MAGLLLRARQLGDIDRLLLVRLVPQQHGAAARRSAANAGSATLLAYVGRKNEDRAVVKQIANAPLTA